jgi:type II secretory pathway component PulF
MSLFLIALVCLPLGLLLLLSVAAAQSAEAEGRPRETSRRVFVLGVVVLGLSVGLLALGLVTTLVRAPQAEALRVVAVLAMLVLAPLGALLIGLSRDLTGRRRHSRWLTPRTLRRLLTDAGYLLSCGPLLIVFPPLGALAIALLVVTLAQFQQSRQTNLLWLLTIAVERGLPLPEELRASAAAVGGRTGEQLQRLAEAVERGEALGEALVRQPELAPRSAALAALIGEQTGTLAETLRTEAARSSRQAADVSQLSSVAGAVLYLWMLVLLLAGVMGFCLYSIVPKYREILADFGVEVPAVTRMVIAASDVMVQGWFLAIPILLVLLAACLAAAEAHRRGWQNLSLSWLTRWRPRLDTPDVLRNLALAVASRTPLPKVLSMLAAHHHRPHISRRLKAAAAAIEGGGDPWEALHDVGLLQAPEAPLLHAAARAGNLAWALSDLADRLERRRAARLLAWYEALRPWPLLLVGGAAAAFALALFLPLIAVMESLL